MSKGIILVGDSLTTLRRVPSDYVQMCVTSPPYYMLRSYSPDKVKLRNDAPVELNTYRGYIYNKQDLQENILDYFERAEIGQEESPVDYINNLVNVFNEVKRLLKPDGTLWINIADTYNGHKKGNDDIHKKSSNITSADFVKKKWEGAKNKDLIGIPWMLAFALRDAGYYLRQDIIWLKYNAMPAPVTDRFTTSKEYIFLLAKNPKYLFNQQKEPCSAKNVEDFKRRKTLNNKGQGIEGSYERVRPDLVKSRDKYMPKDFMRNKRDVWGVNTKPYKSAHVAPYPPELIRPCILAGSNSGDIVLDPFSGAGTSGLVAIQEGRIYVGVELNPDYAKLSQKRILDETGVEIKIKDVNT